MPLVGRERRKAECLPLRANLLDIPLFACHEIMIRHKVDEFVEGFVACVGHNGVSQYRYGGSVAWLGSIAGKQVTVGPSGVSSAAGTAGKLSMLWVERVERVKSQWPRCHAKRGDAR